WCPTSAGRVDRMNHLAYFVGAERAVFIIETIARAVRRSHIKLHEMDVLAQDVSGRANLKVVDEVIIRDEVRVPVLDDVARVAAEEERLRRATAAAGCVSKCRRHVLPQAQDALLREVPAFLVQDDV